MPGDFDISDAAPEQLPADADITPPVHDLSQEDVQGLLARQRALLEDLRSAAIMLARDRDSARELLTEVLLTLAAEPQHGDLVARISGLLLQLRLQSQK